MSLAFLLHYLMRSMFRMLIHPSSGACDLFVELFRGLYCSGSVRVGVTLWFGWGGDTTPPQPNHNITPTRTEPEQYNHTTPAKPQHNTNTHRTGAIQPHHPSQTTT